MDMFPLVGRPWAFSRDRHIRGRVAVTVAVVHSPTRGATLSGPPCQLPAPCPRLDHPRDLPPGEGMHLPLHVATSTRVAISRVGSQHFQLQFSGDAEETFLSTSASADLVAAIVRVNNATRAGASDQEKRAAVEHWCLALKTYSQTEDLWDSVISRAQASARHDSRRDVVRIQAVLSEAHAKLLRGAGYVFPPQPSASVIVEQTRVALGEALSKPADEVRRLLVEDLESVRVRLYEFASSVEEHLESHAAGGLVGALEKCRKLGALGLLAVALSHVELKSGREFAVEVSFSVKEIVTVEITGLPELTSMDLALAQVASLKEVPIWPYQAAPPGCPEKRQRGPDGLGVPRRPMFRAP